MFVEKTIYQEDVSGIKINFPEDILSRQRVVEEIRQNLKRMEAILAQCIKLFQERCAHREVRVMAADSKTAFNIGRYKLAHFLCLDCGRVRQPRQGSNVSVCALCDGDMEYAGYIPGQGGGTRVYKCSQCRHEEACT